MAEEATVTASEEFAEHLMGVLNGGALSLMLSVGHRTGLFDAMARCRRRRARRSRRLRA